MKPMTLLLGVVGVWLLVEALLYWLVVAQALAMTNFLFISAVLLLLVVVAITKWRHSGSDASTSIGNVLDDVEHPPAGRKR